MNGPEGLEVHVNCRNMQRHREAVADALQELKKKIKKAGLMQELKRREHYVAPSERRRVKRDESLKQRKRDERKSQWRGTRGDFS